MISYQREKGEQVYKSTRKTIKNSSSVSFAGNKLSSCFSIKDKTKFEHKHDVIYL